MQEVRGWIPRLGGSRVSQLQASGGISTLQSRASGLQSTTQGNSIRTTENNKSSGWKKSWKPDNQQHVIFFNALHNMFKPNHSFWRNPGSQTEPDRARQDWPEAPGSRSPSSACASRRAGASALLRSRKDEYALWYSYPYPAKDDSTNFLLCSFVLHICSEHCLGHGHGYECHISEQLARRGCIEEQIARCSKARGGLC